MIRLQRTGVVLICLTGGLMACNLGAAKAKRDEPKRERTKSSNESVRTQQRTAEAFADKTARPSTQRVVPDAKERASIDRESGDRASADRPKADRESAEQGAKDRDVLDAAPGGNGSASALAAIEEQIRAEDARHAAAMAPLRAAERAAEKSNNAKQLAAARKATDRQTASHDRVRKGLERKRDDLVRAPARPARESKSEPADGRRPTRRD